MIHALTLFCHEESVKMGPRMPETTGTQLWGALKAARYIFYNSRSQVKKVAILGVAHHNWGRGPDHKLWPKSYRFLFWLPFNPEASKNTKWPCFICVFCPSLGVIKDRLFSWVSVQTLNNLGGIVGKISILELITFHIRWFISIKMLILWDPLGWFSFRDSFMKHV